MPEPELYFFDMDHTLINNDCDVSWKDFLVEKGVAPKDSLKKADYFFDEYVKGQLDFNEFLEFQLLEFKNRTVAEMVKLAQCHFEEKVKSKIYNDARNLVNEALATGKIVSLLTATNNVIAAPVANELGIKYICSTNLEVINGCYTGNIIGPYCGSEGKIIHAKEFCQKHNKRLCDAKYYGDSISDKYILAEVGYPVAVNPGDELKQLSYDNDWEIITLK